MGEFTLVYSIFSGCAKWCCVTQLTHVRLVEAHGFSSNRTLLKHAKDTISVQGVGTLGGGACNSILQPANLTVDGALGL